FPVFATPPRFPMRKVHALLALVLILSGSVVAMTVEQRRDHVAWMRRNLPEVPAWDDWQRATNALPPDFDALPSDNRLPDPLRFTDGRAVQTAADWTERRREMLRLLERHVTGTFPPKPSLDRIVLLDESRGQGYTTRNIRLEFGPGGKGTVRVQVTLPDGPGPFPVLVCPSLPGWGPTLIRRGYASAGFAGNDFMDDAKALKELYPENDFATLPRRAWLVPLVLDYLETLPQVDRRRLALFGYSRDGKMATIAAALDERVAALIAGSTGVGGVLPWRLAGEAGMGEGIESTTRMFPDWFAPQLRFFSGREDRLPVDANSLLALIAPRPVLMQYGLNDEVSNPWALEQVHHSVRRVYEFLGQPVRLDLLRVPGFHGANDPEACLDWLDHQFGRSTRAWTNQFLFPWNFSEWQQRSRDRLDPANPAARRSEAGAPATPVDWEKRRPDIRRSIQWMLGEPPPAMPPLPPRSFPGRGPPPGPTVVAQGATGNPGQLAPDVPAWVISRGGQEFGWLEPEKNQVESRKLRFGYGVTGDLYYPTGTPPDAKLPTVVWLHGHSYPLGYMWVYRRDLHPILALVKAGYAVLAYDQAGFGGRQTEAAPFYDRHPRWSLFGRMVEDARGALDALEKAPIADPERLYLFGYTLGGNVALHTAALDSRVKGVVSVCGLDGGAFDVGAYHAARGLLPRLGFFAGRENEIPYNNAELLATIAPRPVLLVQPTRDRLADQHGVQAAVAEAQAIHATPFKSDDWLTLLKPDDYRRFPTSTQDAVIDWMKEHLLVKTMP
ncbi:MAG TPA: alpha/beta fold hydrolase, partial [Lacunisphaera sp.]|nr:alpha/beta fold hydrolase [Lacunisphaera sp.]